MAWSVKTHTEAVSTASQWGNMSISQTATTSFKVELMQAVHNFGPTSANTFKCALFTAAGTIGPTTTVYTPGMTGEVSSSGTGYTEGGNTLVISQSPSSGNNLAGKFPECRLAKATIRY